MGFSLVEHSTVLGDTGFVSAVGLEEEKNGGETKSKQKEFDPCFVKYVQLLGFRSVNPRAFMYVRYDTMRRSENTVKAVLSPQFHLIDTYVFKPITVCSSVPDSLHNNNIQYLQLTSRPT